MPLQGVTFIEPGILESSARFVRIVSVDRRRPSSAGCVADRGCRASGFARGRHRRRRIDESGQPPAHDLGPELRTSRREVVVVDPVVEQLAPRRKSSLRQRKLRQPHVLVNEFVERIAIDQRRGPEDVGNATGIVGIPPDAFDLSLERFTVG